MMPSSELPELSENVENTNRKKRGWPKGRKRRKSTKDENAPKRPVTGYVRFMNQRRDNLAKENQNMSFAEITKLVGEEWSSMDQQQKAVYINDAEKQKANYLKQLEAYHKSDKYKTFVEKESKLKSQEPPINLGKDNSHLDTEKNSEALSHTIKTDVPIFTESFLDHNKTKESELHQLNRTNAEYEQQNNILETHVCNLRSAIFKLESESCSQDLKNKNLEPKLLYFRELLVNTFAHIPLPNTLQLPTVDSIDSYMVELCDTLESNAHDHGEFASEIYDAMSNASFQTLNNYWNKQEHTG